MSAQLVLQVHQPLQIVLQVAASGTAGAQLEEHLLVNCDGVPVDVTEILLDPTARAHRFTPPAGRLTIEYEAKLHGRAKSIPVTDADRIVFLRPSRYAESDRIAALANDEFAGLTDAAELLAAVSSWVGSRLRYVPGSSGPTDGAVDTLLKRQGVCRDYSHLVIALLRALDVPARLVAVYAPGLNPMDFHAVAEAAVGDSWRVVDATLLAPRSSLIRIATGRDAAETAFLSSYGGAADLLESRITALIDGMLPSDDISELVSLS
jgi:transglutaminase-like putative cysteine protease